jgi:hypothetical protein
MLLTSVSFRANPGTADLCDDRVAQVHYLRSVARSHGPFRYRRE